MPHCIIEHSPEFSSDIIMSNVLRGALASDLFDASGKDIKLRAIPFHHYQTGSNKKPFIHVTLRILSGRSKQQKMRLSESVLTQLKAISTADNAIADNTLTVEVSDIDRETYSKFVHLS